MLKKYNFTLKGQFIFKIIKFSNGSNKMIRVRDEGYRSTFTVK